MFCYLKWQMWLVDSGSLFGYLKWENKWICKLRERRHIKAYFAI
jgi:hypothetical protein